jgi:hypothetical protein
MIIVQVKIDEAKKHVDIRSIGKHSTTPTERELGKKMEGLLSGLMRAAIQTTADPAKAGK